MSRDGLLYLDVVIAAAERIGHVGAKRDLETWCADVAAFDGARTPKAPEWLPPR